MPRSRAAAPPTIGAASTMSCVGGVGDDHGDVVRAAAAQRELHQPLDALLRVGVLAQGVARWSRR